ncbi:hypothetical protein DY000_02007524 [Brassica cretica]|uniref:Peptidylprolyl isomerase n=1 Tax=Brassica cretica TaxID=69181 RepID=A0ABQ7CL07_BRACR|nr:hypothetical protein DY000_02007524 [Brassica cretica]
MIDNPGRFKDDARTVIWLFPGSQLDMRGDRFSIFGEFRSVYKIWLNSYGTIYRDRKNRLRLSSLDYPPSSADGRAGRVFDLARPSAEMDWFSSAIGRAGRVVDPARPSAKLDWSSSADGRAGRVFDPARSSAELGCSCLVDGRAGRVFDPARPSAELVACSIQLGHLPSWTVCSIHPSIKRA